MRTARKTPPMRQDAVGRALLRFRAVLRERSLKMSKVRESIARAALETLQREIAGRYEFELDEHVLELRGRCKECRRARKELE